LKFPEEAKLSPEAKDLICRLLCNVEQRLGTKGADEIKVLCFVWFSSKFCNLLRILCILTDTWFIILFQAHAWFEGTEWNKLYQMKAAFMPEVNDELDTQNFEKFEEVFDLSFMYIYRLDDYFLS
jgi:serine/threonine kinase 38